MQAPENQPELRQTFGPIHLFEKAKMPNKGRAARFWSEPFRPFFILGWCISLIGLALWPLFFLGAVDFPARAHAFLMIQGFFGAFAIGFLWTALPRMLEVPGPGAKRVFIGMALIAGNTLFHLAGFHVLGHVFFLGLLALIAQFGIIRFPARRDLPPPSFVLVGSGFLLGALGTILVAAGDSGVRLGFAYGLGRLLLMETFILFLVMGVAAFLAPRFLRQPSKQSLPDSRVPSKAWKVQAALAAAAGGIILLATVLQATGSIRLGAAIMAAALTGYILYQVPLWRDLATRNWMADGLRIALLCSIATPWARLLFPDARIATTHLLLMGGFGLLTLIVGTRVVFGHSGYSHLFKTRLRPVGIVVGLYTGALIIRIAGEVFPALWMPLLTVSAVLLLAAHAAWGWIALPKILHPRPDEDSPPSPANFTTLVPGTFSQPPGHPPADSSPKSQLTGQRLSNS